MFLASTDAIPLFDELAIIAAIATLFAVVLARLRLPAVAGLLLAGALLGPHAIGAVHSQEAIDILAEIGVVLLLFTIGLEFSLARLRHIFRQVAVGGILQLGLTFGATFGVAVALGRPTGEATLLGFVFGLSSTAIVLRGLAERRELDAPHGRFIVGTLILQDLAVVPMVLVIPLLGPDATGDSAAGVGAVFLALGKAALVVTAALGVARLIVPRILGWVDESGGRDVFLLAVLAVCVGTAFLTSLAGLSLALGAFLGGMVLAESPYGHRALGDVLPLRDLFVSLFFVSLGMLFDVRVLLESPLQVALLLVAFMLGKGFLATLAAMVMRFPSRVAWLAGVGLAQFGEFGFVLAKLGQEAHVVSPETMRPVLAAGILSMFLTPLLVRLAPHVTAGERLLAPLERLIGVRAIDTADAAGDHPRDHVIIVGFGLAARMLAGALRERGIPYLVLELDAERVRTAADTGQPVFYADATSPEAMGHAHLERARAMVLLISDPNASQRIVDCARHLAPSVPIFVRTKYWRDRVALLGHGPTHAISVVAEELEGGVVVADRVLQTLGVSAPEAREAAARAMRDVIGE
ncbi:MAG: cation:proton antiporter [Deltaproteobacteria bacterium]|nr:cation:proton antiporter [Deltaproteobacteria bacterium]